ncbi:MAG: hypothetical protein AABW88_04485 [Nanoarchaeota archaeon]
MKRGVLGLMILLMMVSVSASYFPEPGVIFQIKKTNCTENGTIILDITHEGGLVKFSDIKINTSNSEFKTQLIGEWVSKDNYKLAENYTDNDLLSKSWLRFRTTNNVFTKGKYIITLSWPSNTIYYDKTMAAVECPGIICKTNNDCVNQQSCVNNVCEWIACPPSQFATGHTCIPKCEDYNSCTSDYYTEGSCTYIKKQGCCNKDIDCEKENKCLTQKCVIKGENIFERFWNWLKSKY